VPAGPGLLLPRVAHQLDPDPELVPEDAGQDPHLSHHHLLEGEEGEGEGEGKGEGKEGDGRTTRIVRIARHRTSMRLLWLYSRFYGF
jgi:hypothetical protein